MSRFMEQHCGALSIVDWNLKKFRVDGHDFEWKICSGIGVAMTDVLVPPVVCAAKHREMLEEECFSTEALLLQERDRVFNFLALLSLKAIGAYQERDVPNYQNDEGGTQNPDDSFQEASLLCFRSWQRGLGSALLKVSILSEH